MKDSKRSGLVYLIPCKDCREVYVGQAGHLLEHRVNEHKRALNSIECNTSAVVEHAIKNKYGIEWGIAKIVDRVQEYYRALGMFSECHDNMSFHVQKWPDFSNDWLDILSKKEAKKKEGKKKEGGKKGRKKIGRK